MPIRIPRDLPAFNILHDEGVMVMSDEIADRQDIRPLKIALLNLMPMKIETETQFARLIGSTPLQIELTLVNISNRVSKNTSTTHMETFYKPFSELKEKRFDGLLITGAPIEHLQYERVEYWNELTEIFGWSQTNVHSTLAVCWGAMAMLNYFYKIKKHMLEKKAFGCFEHINLNPNNKYLRGFMDKIIIPVSRWTEVKESDIANHTNLNILLSSNTVGPCLIEDTPHRALYMFNHLEYDTRTLNHEYVRDLSNMENPQKPENYFPHNDPSLEPLNRWRSHGHLLYGNWINEIYQTTPFKQFNIGLMNI